MFDIAIAFSAGFVSCLLLLIWLHAGPRTAAEREAIHLEQLEGYIQESGRLGSGSKRGKTWS